jgi:DNA helicase II / ATP-dependent DNA helicase PcrA
MTDGDEGRFVASSIFETKMNNQVKNGSFAILYRTNAQSRAMEDALRKKDIPYRIYGGLSFYQRKEIKDVLSYLRLVLNPKDEEALKRVINYPARGIGDTTIDRIMVAANHYNRSMFEVMQNIDKIDLKINSGTKTKLRDFVTMIQSFQITNQNSDAFQITKDGTPEGIARIENIEELLNGMRDFVEEQKELADATGSLAEFMEDVALATDLDNDKGDEDRVALMTVHLAKGLEFPYVYVVGMEEELFPSGMSMNTRSELEEERRLFYVAITRAEKQAYLTYTQSRYRWGKLIDAEPSRFIEEIDAQYLEYLTPITEHRYKPLLDSDIFDEIDKSKLRLRKPIAGSAPKGPTEDQLRKLRRLKPVTSDTDKNFSAADANLNVGTLVEHVRFGKGKITKIEGTGADTKAEIDFENGGLKKLLLRFAKLNVLE